MIGQESLELSFFSSHTLSHNVSLALMNQSYSFLLFLVHIVILESFSQQLCYDDNPPLVRFNMRWAKHVAQQFR